MHVAGTAECPVHSGDHEAESDDTEGDPPYRAGDERDREDRRGQSSESDEDAEDEAFGGESGTRGRGLGFRDIPGKTRVFTAQLLIVTSSSTP